MSVGNNGAADEIRELSGDRVRYVDRSASDLRSADVVSFIHREYLQNEFVLYEAIPNRTWFLSVPDEFDFDSRGLPDFAVNMFRIGRYVLASMDEHVARVDIIVPNKSSHLLTRTWREYHLRETPIRERYAVSIRHTGRIDFARLEIAIRTVVWCYTLTEPYREGQTLEVRHLARTVVAGERSFLPEDPRWYETNRTLSSCDILTVENTRKKRIIFGGDEVTVEVRRGSALVELDGAAIDSGGIGDEVSVRLNISGKVVAGTVSGARRVHVKLL